MLAKIYAAAVNGIDGVPIEVEVDVGSGLPSYQTVGLPDTAIKESKDRVKSAIKNSGFEFPVRKVVVSLAPADFRKEGSAFDLPIAIGMLAATYQVKSPLLTSYFLLGELALDGKLRPVRGALSMAVAARDNGMKGMILPRENGDEASVVEGIDIFPVRSLNEAVNLLEDGLEVEPHKASINRNGSVHGKFDVDFREVKGQAHAKRALEVAASGGHNVLMVGPPGSGKTMLAKRLPGILPPPSLEEAIEITKIHSVAGLLPGRTALIDRRPFRSPHHSISDAGLIGGGHIPTPGEISLAHNGVLFLDELPEFKRSVLEVMRQPLEDGQVTIARAASTLTFPSRIILVAAMNPCPCGNFGHPTNTCSCSPQNIFRYHSRISAPLLDRIDIHIEVPSVKVQELSSDGSGDSSGIIRKRVSETRKIQRGRFPKNAQKYCNAHMSSRDIKEHCKATTTAIRLLETAINRLGLSARAYDRVLKVSRTIADLEGADTIDAVHVSEAINYRSLDRDCWRNAIG